MYRGGKPLASRKLSSVGFLMSSRGQWCEARRAALGEHGAGSGRAAPSPTTAGSRALAFRIVSKCRLLVCVAAAASALLINA